MPSTTTIAASGKAVVSGEYAVLWGGAAIAVPVARAEARMEAAADPVQFRVHLMPFGLDLFGQRASGTLAATGSDDGVGQGFAKLWQAALGLWGKPAQLDRSDYVLDTAELYRPDGTKWGWGSSGAAKALLVRIWFPTATGTAELYARVRELEQVVGSAGSGIDSAVALTGTALHFTMQGFRSVEPRGEYAYWIALPESVKTETRVSTVLQAVATTERRMLMDAARHSATAYHAGSQSQWLAALSDYDQCLEAVLEPLGLARFDKHVNNIQLRLGAAWYVRPSGAGGDGVLALPTGPAQTIPDLNLPFAPLQI